MLSQSGIVRSYQFKISESKVDNYVPSKEVCGSGQFSMLSQFPSIVQHVTQVRIPHKDSIYIPAKLSFSSSETDEKSILMQHHKVKYEILKLYPRVPMEPVHDVTVKVCDRVKSPPVIVCPDDKNPLNNQVMYTTETEYFLTGSAFRKVNTYFTEGSSTVFILNEFADLKALIPEARRHITFKATLTSFKMYRSPESQLDKVKILSEVFKSEELE